MARAANPSPGTSRSHAKSKGLLQDRIQQVEEEFQDQNSNANGQHHQNNPRQGYAGSEPGLDRGAQANAGMYAAGFHLRNFKNAS